MESAIINGIFGLIGVVIAVLLEEYLRRRWFPRAMPTRDDVQAPLAVGVREKNKPAIEEGFAKRTSITSNLGRRRPYEELQIIVDELGGQMRFERAGRPQGGTWIVSLPGHAERMFDSNGAGFPPLDGLYVPKVPNPTHYRDYSNDLQPDSRDRWISLIRGS